MYNSLNEANSNDIGKMYGIARGAINVASGSKKSGSKNEYSYSSLASAASKMVAVFPVLTSRTVSAETAQMVSKYIEQKMCSLFVLALQQANISTAKNGIEYLRQYHQNLDTTNDDVGSLIKVMDTWIKAYDAGNPVTESSVSAAITNNSLYADESSLIGADIDFESIFESDMDLDIPAKDVAEVVKLMQELGSIEVMDTKLNPVSINDFIVNEMSNGDYHVSIKALDEASNGKRKGGGLRSSYRRGVNSGAYSEDEAFQRQADNDADEDHAYQNRKRRWEEEDRTASRARDTARERERQEDREQAKADRERDKEEKERRARDEENARRMSGNNVSLKDMDVKKMNDAVPSLLVVRFYSMQTDENGNVTHQSSVPTEFVIGVKSKLYPVTTSEILRRIMNDNKDGKKFTKLMRVVTRELNPIDVLFGFDRMKDDVRSTKRKGSYGAIWNLLANRAIASKEAVKHGQHNDYSAISTVVISQNDVDELFHEENLDISDPRNALHFMKSYNLIGFVITDDATETVRILMDDDSAEFEEYAYRMFERETKDGTYKKLINLMAASK